MKKFINKNKFLKAVITLLIAVVMVSFSTAVVATDAISTQTEKTNPEVGPLDEALIDEGFEDNVMPPEGWTVIINEPDVTWQITEDLVYSGDYAAYCPGAAPPYDQDEWLITPEVDCTYAQDINLEFWANCLTYADDWTLYLYVKIVGGDWVELWDCIEEELWYDGLWHNKTFNLDEYSGEVIQLAWQSVGIGSRDFYLDQIKLYAGEIPPPAELNLTVPKFQILKLDADILNVATDERGIAKDVVWTMSLMGAGALKKLNWSSNGTIGEILPGGFETIGFNDPIFGLSFNMNLTITAEDTNDPRVNKINESYKVIIFLIFVIVLDQQ